MYNLGNGDHIDRESGSRMLFWSSVVSLTKRSIPALGSGSPRIRHISDSDIQAMAEAGTTYEHTIERRKFTM